MPLAPLLLRVDTSFPHYLGHPPGAPDAGLVRSGIGTSMCGLASCALLLLCCIVLTLLVIAAVVGGNIVRRVWSWSHT